MTHFGCSGTYSFCGQTPSPTLRCTIDWAAVDCPVCLTERSRILRKHADRKAYQEGSDG